MTVLDFAPPSPAVRADLRKLAVLPLRDLVGLTEPSLRGILRTGLPRRGESPEVNRWRARNSANLWRGARQVLAARALKLPTMYGQLGLKVIRADGEEIDYGLASLRVVTTAGCNFIVSAFLNTAELEVMKYHGIGTGTNAEASSDTALQTELTTQYTPSNTRATGSQAVGGSNNIYVTTGTNTSASNGVAVTEHGVFSQAATGGGTLLDRSVFSTVTLNTNDSIQTPYSFTAVAGG